MSLFWKKVMVMVWGATLCSSAIHAALFFDRGDFFGGTIAALGFGMALYESCIAVRRLWKGGAA